MKTVCEINRCAGCMACVEACAKGAISIADQLKHYNAVIAEDKCVDCGRCHHVCPNNERPAMIEPVSWYQGWAADEIRTLGSSGGAATAIINGFLKDGGHVCSCVFKNGEFIFEITSDINDAKMYAGSKYVKSNPVHIYRRVAELLRIGEKVLFLGLPCQSAGLQNHVKKEKNKDLLYTVDLICHGTPSPQLLNKYLKESSVSVKEIGNIKFRVKNRFGLYIDNKRLVPTRVVDAYTRAFLTSLDYTDNCYSCQFATSARVSDLTLGDAWGSDKEQMSKGISLILCQNDKGRELLKLSELTLETADPEVARAHNHQLVHPSLRHKGEGAFWRKIQKGKSFRAAVFYAMPKDSAKQGIKCALAKVNSKFR